VPRDPEANKGFVRYCGAMDGGRAGIDREWQGWGGIGTCLKYCTFIGRDRDPEGNKELLRYCEEMKGILRPTLSR